LLKHVAQRNTTVFSHTNSERESKQEEQRVFFFFPPNKIPQK